MSTEYNAYALLNSTEELRLLAHTWTTQNKSRVYLAGQSKKCSTIHPIVPSTTSIPTSSIPNSSTVPVGANSTVHVLASMRQVMASRKDLVGITSTISQPSCYTGSHKTTGYYLEGTEYYSNPVCCGDGQYRDTHLENRLGSVFDQESPV